MGIRYATTRIDDAVEDLSGVRVPDPYRWLEEDTDEVREWQRQQAALASSYVRDWSRFSEARDLVESHTKGARKATIPRFAAGRWFREATPPGHSAPQVVVADEAFGEGRVVVDLSQFRTGSDLPYLSWLSPSPDGKVLAIGVCIDGSENNSIRLIDVATSIAREDAPRQLLHDAWAGGAVWLPDSSGYYFLGLTGPAQEFQQDIYLHRLFEGPPTEGEEVPLPEGSRDYTVIQVSKDGRWAVASHRMANPIPVAIRDLTRPHTAWRPFVTDVDGVVAGHILDDNYVAITDIDAPNGRLVAIPLYAADPNDTEAWRELMSGSDSVMRTVTPVGAHLYVTEFKDTYARVRIVDTSGQTSGFVPLPGQGALSTDPFPLMSLPTRGHPDEFLFAFSSLVSSWGIYRHQPGHTTLQTLQEPAIVLDAIVDEGRARSADGTLVPYHAVRPTSKRDAGALPTLIYAYGSSNVPYLPQYPGALAAFVSAGGVLVQAHLRGGGEFGRAWYEAGNKRNISNRDADLIAVAEHLIANKMATPDRLGVTGGSAGGAMCGITLTKRPDLWRAVIPRIPLLDLIGGLRDPYLAWVIPKVWADPDDPEEIQRLLTLSPYNLITPETEYPAVYVQAGDTDPRCAPWHARKFVARLQAAQLGDAPILLTVYENAGHGSWATDPSIILDMDADMLAFALKTLGPTV